jgi:acetylornithine deacetylase/succinyl-diaminopimelate desuccinylase-like protein
VRTVPEQDPHKIVEACTTFLEEKFLDLNSPNQLTITPVHIGDWWVGDPKNSYFKQAAKCVEEVWGVKPIFTREGGSLPIIPFLADTFQAPIILIAIGQSSDGAHSQNERIRELNLRNGQQVLRRFIEKTGKS